MKLFIEAILMSTLNIPKDWKTLTYCHLLPDLTSWLTTSGSNCPYFEQISMVPKMFESLRFGYITFQTWSYDKSWHYCIDYLGADEHEFDVRHRYRVEWSIPTRRKPIPRATARVYFTFQVSKVKPKVRKHKSEDTKEMLQSNSFWVLMKCSWQPKKTDIYGYFS